MAQVAVHLILKQLQVEFGPSVSYQMGYMQQ